MQQQNRRVEERTKTLTPGRLRGDWREQDVCIVDVSSRGLAATAEHPPQRGDFVELVVGDNTLVGHVRWSSTRRFGIALQDRISVISLLSGDREGIKLKQRHAVEKKQARAAVGGQTQSHKLEFLIICGAAILGTFIVADFVGDALEGLQLAKVAMARVP